MKPYDPKTIEPKWQKIWNETGLYKTVDDPKGKKDYVLTMFPYTSGDLHTGHWYALSGPDIVARRQRMLGNDVLHPMGFDAFGLPAENAAIKNNIPPAKWTRENIERMTKQLQRIGTMYDWDKVLSTADPDYYRWTQWLFLKFYEMGLAYREKGWQNWCPKDQTVLANEQVVGENNVCERCGTPVVKKELEQWFFKITDYAERLLDDLEDLDWPKRVKLMQQNWIGKSEGMLFSAPVKDTDLTIQTFSAHFEAFRADTFVVLAPDHPFLPELVKGVKDEKKILDFAAEIIKKRDKKGYADEELVEGIFTGRYIEDPVGNGDLPIWVASYALAHYGTGIVKCSVHDERDFRFAKKYGLPLKPVLFPKDAKEAAKVRNLEVCYTDMQNGILVEPEEFNGEVAGKITDKIISYLEKHKLAQRQTSYRLRDWLVSRQRYWGAPIPIVYCETDGIVPVPEKDLPVKLPEDVEFKPTGQSPLIDIPEFVNAKCPKCGKPAKRETDTMDTFVDSSWYYLRFPNPQYDKGPFDPSEVKKWLPVNHYLGGIEHAILHLLYSRFVTKALRDAKLVDFKEPFVKLSNQGIILGPDGQKMSKSRGNVVNPDEQVAAYGADTFRAYLMFTGPWKDGGPFDVKGIAGLRRWLERVWVLVREFDAEKDQAVETVDNQDELATRLDFLSNKATKQVSKDIEETTFNTAIAALMELTNGFYKVRSQLPFGASPESWLRNLETLLKLMAPITPHIAEELWHELGNEQSIHIQSWPEWDDALIKEEVVTIVVQVNGKVRANIAAAADIEEKTMVTQAKADPKVAEHLKGKHLLKTITVPAKLVNFVVK